MFDKKLTLKSSLVVFILQSLIQDVPPAQLVVEDGLLGGHQHFRRPRNA